MTDNLDLTLDERRWIKSQLDMVSRAIDIKPELLDELDLFLRGQIIEAKANGHDFVGDIEKHFDSIEKMLLQLMTNGEGGSGDSVGRIIKKTVNRSPWKSSHIVGDYEYLELDKELNSIGLVMTFTHTCKAEDMTFMPIPGAIAPFDKPDKPSWCGRYCVRPFERNIALVWEA